MATQLQNRSKNGAILIFALLFQYLFIDQSFGINLIVAEALLLTGYLIWSRRIVTPNLLIAWAVSLFAVIATANAISVCTNLLLFLLLLAWDESPQANLLHSSMHIFLRLRPTAYFAGHSANRGVLFWITYLFLPCLLFFLFFTLYAHSIPYFFELFEKISSYLPELKARSIFLFLAGIGIATYSWRKYLGESIQNLFPEELTRKKGRERFAGLNTRYRRICVQAIFSLCGLLFMGAMALALDMRFFWFSDAETFSYEEAQWALRKGTGGLVVAILASIAVALYFFRGNMAFYSGNKLLKKMTFAWLALNVLLCLSLLVRTFLYIDQFNLAYKRIAVLVFIACALWGIGTVMYQMARRRNFWFLLRTNSQFFLLVLLVMGCFNWDGVIVRYNLRNSQAYQDLDFIFTRDLGSILTAEISDEVLDKTIQGSKNHEWLPRKYGYITYRQLLNVRLKSWDGRHERDWRSWSMKEYRVQKGSERWLR